MNIFKRNKIAFQLLISLSSLAFALVISPCSIFRAITYGLICVILSAIIVSINPSASYKAHKFFSILCSMIVAVVCLKLVQSFCYRWSVQSPENNNPIFYLVYSRDFRTIVSFILVALSIPFLFFLFKNLFFYVYLFIKKIDTKEFVKYIRLKMLPKKVILVTFIVVLSSVIAFFLLTSLYSLMPSADENRMIESAQTINKEGDNPSMFEWCTSALDNWTDSLMMLCASNNKNDSTINRALLSYYGSVSNTSPFESLTKHYIDNIPFDSFEIYARYWHGYILFLRPLLSVFSYREIRIINAVLQTILTLVILLLLRYRKLSHLILPYFISVCMLMPIVISKSLQFSSCFYIFSIISILILVCGSKQNICSNRLFPFIFLLSGILTSFIDFLTYPLSTFGIPMVLYISLCRNKQFEKLLANFLENSVLWFFGYSGMWICKWIIADVFTNGHVIAEGIENVLNRTSHEGFGNVYSLIEVEYQNLRAFFKTPVSIIIVVLVIAVLVLLHKYKNKFTVSANVLYNQISFYVITALFPIAWYAILLNHSAIHTFFTNKACVVLVFALTAIFSTLYHELKNFKQRK